MIAPKKQSITIPADTPAAFSYRRVSDDKQAESGLGEDAQLRSHVLYIDQFMKPNGFVWGGDFLDSAVSARKNAFLKRPAADRLNLTLRKGDCVVMSKLDRAFRSVLDFAQTFEHWRARGISVAFVADHFQTWNAKDPMTAQQKAMLGMSAVFAELESSMISIRTKEAMAAKRARGEPLNQKVPPGKSRWGNRLIDDPNERAICRLIVAMRDKGYSAYQIFCHLRTNKVRRRDGREWTERMIYSADRVERERMHVEGMNRTGSR